MSKLFSSRSRDAQLARRTCAEETLRFDSEVIRLRESQREAATKFAALQDEFNRAQSRLTRAELENVRLREEIGLANARALEAVVNLGTKGALENAHAKLHSLEAESKAARRRIRVLERFQMKAAVYERALASIRNKNDELEGALEQARERIKALQNNLAVTPSSQEFRKVGLHQDCPDFVLKAVRKTYRKELHPDTQPIHLKSDAEDRFKEAEAVFDRLYAHRGLS